MIEGLENRSHAGLSDIQLGPGPRPTRRATASGPRFRDYVAFQYGLVVSPVTSERIVNELADRKTVTDAILTVGAPCIGIADSAAVRTAGWSIDRCLEKVSSRAPPPVRPRVVYGLEFAHSVPPWSDSQLCRAEIRHDYQKPIIAGTAPVAHPPYYGMRLWPKVHHTMGGLRINSAAQVINLDGTLSKAFMQAR